MKKTIKTISVATLLLAMLATFGLILQVAYDGSMKVHCNNLEAMSHEYKDFFVSSLDKEECSSSYGINISAEVR